MGKFPNFLSDHVAPVATLWSTNYGPQGATQEGTSEMALMRKVDAAQVQRVRSGRPENEYDLQLLEDLLTIQPGEAGVFDTWGAIPGGIEGRKDRAKVSAEIRRHWRKAYGEFVKVSIDYTADGYPQVYRKVDK